MVLGRVSWFGGLNKKTGKANNFGFLDVLNETDREGIYVSRKNVPFDIQPLLESGVDVAFDIIENDKGEKSAINVKMPLLVGTIAWFSNGRGYIKCPTFDDVRVETSENFHPGDIVSFHIKHNAKYGRTEAVIARRVERSTQDSALIALCARSSQTSICIAFIAKYVLLLPEDAAIKFILEKINSFELKAQQTMLHDIMQQSEKLFLLSSELRKRLVTDSNEAGYDQYSLALYCKFIDKNILSQDDSLRKELLVEVREKLSIAAENSRAHYWKNSTFLKNNVRYRGDFWELSTTGIKTELVCKKYSRFFALVSKFSKSEYPFSSSISSSWQDLYVLSEVDDALTELWCGDTRTAFEKAKMISARGAEKLVLKFFDDMGHQVEDIAAHQVTKQSNHWKKADIQIDSKFYIDVKNARKEVNSEAYSEFCVPKFKQEHSSDVFISAVLSPYLQHEFMKGASSPRFPVKNPRVLGVSSANKLSRLKKDFDDDMLTLERDGFDPKKYLPPWLFDYSKKFYLEQNEVKDEFMKLQDSDILEGKDLVFAENMPVSLFLASNRPLPASWISELPRWQVDFAALLTSFKEISLPYLFLSLLKHFLCMLPSEDPSYSPQEYKNLLYTGSNHPLRLYDPLDIIKDLCNTLQVLWNKRKVANAELTDFKVFKLTGRGLLRGKRSNDDESWTTILAYCGGKIEGKGKCGFTPLVIGKDPNCNKCGYLICPQPDCGCCQSSCERYLSVRKKQTNRR